MQVTKETTGNLTATIKIEMEQADYQEKVNEQLKEYQQKAKMQGFRPGKVPFGLIKKMYGRAILIDVVNKLGSESLLQFIKDNDIKAMFYPLPNKDKGNTFEPDEDSNLIFYFDIGEYPEFTLDISDKIEVDYLNIPVAEEEIDKHILSMRKRLGPVETVESIGENDMVKGQFVELNENGTPKDDGIKNEGYIYMEQLIDEDTKKKLLGLKVDVSVEIDPKKIARSDYEVAYFLGVKTEQLTDITSKFQFQILNITRVGLAELNEEFYSKIFPSDKIESEEQFRLLIRRAFESEYTKECERKFISDLIKNVREANDFELPDSFIKRYLVESDEKGELTYENIDSEYEKMKKGLKWQLIESRLDKEYGLEVNDRDVRAYLNDYFKAHYKIPIKQKHEPIINLGLENDIEKDYEQLHDYDVDIIHNHESEDEHEHNHDLDPNNEQNSEIEIIENIEDNVEYQELDDYSVDYLIDSYLNDENHAKEIKESLYEDRILSLLKSKITIKEVETTYENFIKLIQYKKN